MQPLPDEDLGPDAANDGTAIPFVSVIIPHYNDLAALAVCHDHLRRQTWPHDRFEMIVADNMSRCGLDAVRAAAPNANVILAEIQGAGPARNAGVAVSRGKILAFLDSDCVPDRDWLANGVDALERWDFVGGKVAVFPQDSAHPSAVESFEMVFNFNFKRYIEKVGFTGTGNMFVPRTTFDAVGGFRNGVSEDMDWSFRARDLGYKLGYAPKAVVGHPARAEWRELQRRWIRLITETYALKHEKRFGRAAFIARALLMPASIIPHTAQILMSDRLRGVHARFGAIQVLIRLRLWRMATMLRVALHSDAAAQAVTPLPAEPGR